MIKNLIFDFGGVLYKINPELTIIAMSKLTKDKNKFNQNIKTQNYLNYIRDFEKGIISTIKFRKLMKQEFYLNCSNYDFDKAWNSLLIDLTDFAIPLIKNLKKHYKLYLLSNTNTIHYNYFLPQCRELFSLFEKCFFSFKIGSVKPEFEIFKFVINKNNIYADETLFIDDSKDNIIVANELGFQTFLVENLNTTKILKLLETQ